MTGDLFRQPSRYTSYSENSKYTLALFFRPPESHGKRPPLLGRGGTPANDDTKYIFDDTATPPETPWTLHRLEHRLLHGSAEAGWSE
jgi:hypothetical protein